MKPHPAANEFDQKGNRIGSWDYLSQNFYYAAKAVWDQATHVETKRGSVYTTPRYPRPAHLLMGLSLETLLKGLLVARDPSLISGGKISKVLTSHDLTNLFEKAKILLANDEEKDFVFRLSQSVIWLSKYPVPIRPEALPGSDDEFWRLNGWNENDFERFSKLRQRVLELFVAMYPG